jgi:hypothetical protein
MNKELQELLASMARPARHPVRDGTLREARDQIAARRQTRGPQLNNVCADVASAGS